MLTGTRRPLPLRLPGLQGPASDEEQGSHDNGQLRGRRMLTSGTPVACVGFADPSTEFELRRELHEFNDESHPDQVPSCSTHTSSRRPLLRSAWAGQRAAAPHHQEDASYHGQYDEEVKHLYRGH